VVADMGIVYHATAGVLGVVFLALTVRLRRSPRPELAMRVFSYSITYLTVLFVVMVADELVRHGL
jgi:protoheme IX farnesyltransferase